jgi:hypothetical protein
MWKDLLRASFSAHLCVLCASAVKRHRGSRFRSAAVLYRWPDVNLDNEAPPITLIFMKTTVSLRPSLFPWPAIKSTLAAAALIASLGLAAVAADAPKSLLPAFGNEGAEFTTKSANSNTVHGWLPAEWKDNSEWAPVSATYSKLTDSPDKAVGAVRIKIEKVDEGGQLQLTTYGGNQKYKKGIRYVVTGWLRSPDRLGVKVGTRQINEPYEFYNEEDLATGAEWKRFEFAFTPTMDYSAFLMFIVREPGTVDLAGVIVEEKP